MTIQEAWKEGNDILSEAGIQEAKLDSRYLLEWVLEKDYSFVIQNPSYIMPEEAKHAYRLAIRLRMLHKPLQYITGSQEFMGINFQVNEHVLIPRQDTEILVETVWKRMQKMMIDKMPALVGAGQNYRLLDLCCGSGCIGLSLWEMLKKAEEKHNAGKAFDRKKEEKHDAGKPLDRKKEEKNNTGKSLVEKGNETEKLEGFKQWDIMLSDVSPEALEVSCQNAEHLQAEVTLRESDLFHNIEETFHIIVSNPPYIPSAVVDTLMQEVREYEPRLALDGEEDGLYFYRKILEQAGDHLEDGGYVFFEIGYDQAEAVRNLMVAAGLDQITVKQDLAGLDRVIYGKKASALKL